MLDTCHAGWVPTAIRMGIKEWLDEVKETKILTPESLAFFKKVKLMRYGRLRFAAFHRVYLLRIVTGSNQQLQDGATRQVLCP